MKKFLYIIIIFSISFYLSIEFIGDRLIKNKLEKNISNALNREVLIDKLNIKYLSGEADIFGIHLLNKKFEGELARIDTVKLNLDTLSLYSNNIIINNVLIENIKLNYYFNFTDQIVSDNVRSLEKDLKNKNYNSQSDKYFNITNLDAKNISLSVISPNLDISKTLKLNDLNFNNIGNTSESKNYKDVLRDIFNDTVELVKEKALSEDFLNKLENFDPKQIENKIKDKLKNKLKKLVN